MLNIHIHLFYALASATCPCSPGAHFYNVSGQRTQKPPNYEPLQIYFSSTHSRCITETNRAEFFAVDSTELLRLNINIFPPFATARFSLLCMRWRCREWKHFSPDYSLNVYRKSSNFIFISLKLSTHTQHIPDLFDFNSVSTRRNIYSSTRDFCCSASANRGESRIRHVCDVIRNWFPLKHSMSVDNWKMFLRKFARNALRVVGCVSESQAWVYRRTSSPNDSMIKFHSFDKCPRDKFPQKKNWLSKRIFTFFRISGRCFLIIGASMQSLSLINSNVTYLSIARKIIKINIFPAYVIKIQIFSFMSEHL